MDVVDGDSSGEAAGSLDVCRAGAGWTGKGYSNKCLQCVVRLLWFARWVIHPSLDALEWVRMRDRG